MKLYWVYLSLRWFTKDGPTGKIFVKFSDLNARNMSLVGKRLRDFFGEIEWLKDLRR